MNTRVNVSNIEGDEAELLRVNFNRPYARYNGYVIVDELKEYVDSLLEMRVKDDDIWVCSYPKTGTTWTQEMVFCVANNADLSKAQKPLNDRYVFLDKCFLVPKIMANHIESEINRVKNLLSNGTTESDPKPRFIHTHLPFELLPHQLRDGSTKAKIIYVVRNPRDTSISAFNHTLMVGRYKGSLKNYTKLFMKGLVNYGPFWKHVQGFWQMKNEENVLFIKYENMKKDLPTVIRKTATFLERTIADQQMAPLCQHLSFESMKNNPYVNEKPLLKILKTEFNPQGGGEFFRKGKSDQWKNEFELELVQRFEQWEYENLKHFNVTSYHDL